jgi:hypothetical protein
MTVCSLRRISDGDGLIDESDGYAARNLRKHSHTVHLD